MEIKVGDKVRVLYSEYYFPDILEMVGGIFEVNKVRPSDNAASVLNDKSEDCWFISSCLELIKEQKELKDIEQGDKIVDGNGNKRMTLGKCGLVVFISFIDDFSVVASPRTIEELERGGYSVYQEPEEEVVEMTLEEVIAAASASIGKNVKIKE